METKKKGYFPFFFCAGCAGSFAARLKQTPFCAIMALTFHFQELFMQAINFNCPNCGAPIQADAGSRQTTCPYCSSTVMLDDGVQHVQYDNAEQAGYEFEKGRQRARAEQGYEVPQKKHTGLWVLGWILCFPIPLTILVVRSKSLHVAVKAGIITVVWLAYFGIGLYGEKSNSSQQESGTEPATEQVSESGYCALPTKWLS